ncbi:MAG TPA: hypothetical protein VKV32_02945 [Stellaceae bacterium]|nr:hypothetical protein [Stellaceae bacterium]
MTSFDYYLLDAGAQLIVGETLRHSDILDAFERMRALLDEHAEIETIQLWQGEHFIGLIKRSDGRLIMRSRVDPPPAHPLFPREKPETKAS